MFSSRPNQFLLLAAVLSACGPVSQAPDGGTGTDGNGQCPVTCTLDEDCCPGQQCIGGVCTLQTPCPSGCNWECDKNSGQICNPATGLCETGSAPLACASDCDCYAGETCLQGQCVATCEADVDCPEGQICGDSVCQPAACQTRQDCAGPVCLVCKNGECVPPADVCVGDEECCVGYHCNFGTCEPDGEGCQADSDCLDPAKPVCVDGKCVPSEPECQIDSDCPGEGQVCQDGCCVQPGCTAQTCPQGQWCDPATGLCKEGCDSNEDCTPPATCDYASHRCVVVDCCGGVCDPVTQVCDPVTCQCTDLCNGDADCPEGTHCDQSTGLCVADVVECDPAEFSSPIQCGDTVSGAFETGCEATQRPGSLAKQFTFTGQAGIRITVNLSSAVDTYLYLLDSTGAILASNDDGGVGNDSEIIFVLEADGGYVIEATTFASGVTGAFDLALTCSQGPGCTEEPIACGDVVTGTWSADCNSYHRSGAYARLYTFADRAGDLVTIDLSSTVDTYLYLLDPTGAVLASNDDNGIGTDSQIQEVLSADATYTIEATTLMPEMTGSFELSLHCAEASECTVPISCGDVIAGSWTGQCQAPDRWGSYGRLYTFEASRNQDITVTLKSQDVDTYLYLLDPEGEIAASDDDGGMGSNSRIAGTVLVGGTWTIEATTYGMDQTGDFELELQCN
jgi:hypothetical protein